MLWIECFVKSFKREALINIANIAYVLPVFVSQDGFKKELEELIVVLNCGLRMELTSKNINLLYNHIKSNQLTKPLPPTYSQIKPLIPKKRGGKKG